MPNKDTAQLENELQDADDVKEFLKANEQSFQSFTLAEYFNHLLDEKNCRGRKLSKIPWSAITRIMSLRGARKLRGKMFCRLRRQ